MQTIRLLPRLKHRNNPKIFKSLFRNFSHFPSPILSNAALFSSSTFGRKCHSCLNVNCNCRTLNNNSNYRLFSTTTNTQSQTQTAESDNETTELSDADEEEIESNDESDDNNIQAELESELGEAQSRITELESDLKKFREALSRSHADMINYQNISKRDVEKAKLYSNKAFAKEMLLVYDSLAAAMRQINENPALKTDAKAVTDGIELTQKTLLNTFKKNHITRIESMNQLFDPSVHEALFNIENGEQPINTVLQVVNEGFRIRDQVLRSAKVGVSCAPIKPVIIEEDEDVEEDEEKVEEDEDRTDK